MTDGYRYFLTPWEYEILKQRNELPSNFKVIEPLEATTLIEPKEDVCQTQQ